MNSAVTPAFDAALLQVFLYPAWKRCYVSDACVVLETAACFVGGLFLVLAFDMDFGAWRPQAPLC